MIYHLNFLFSFLFFFVLRFWVYNDTGLAYLLDVFFLATYTIYDIWYLRKYIVYALVAIVVFSIQFIQFTGRLREFYPEKRIVKRKSFTYIPSGK